MRKRNILFVLFLCYTGFAYVSGCSSTNIAIKESNEDTNLIEESKAETYEIALITDLGTIDDRSFNQASWEGMKKYAQEKNITCTYYKPEEGTTDSYVETIDLAIQGGAKLVVCPGFLFETPVFIAQDKYPDTQFILIDGEPHNAAYSESRIEKNVLSILFQEEQAGFLAGYAAVRDGNTKLGFVGGMAVPAVIRYGYGFVQGCDLAAKEMGISTEIMYTYTGSFNATEQAEELSASWYQGGTEVIFACGGAVCKSVIAAAEKQNTKVIGVDVDQSQESEAIITSAMKNISAAVYQGIEAYYTDSFQGGTAQIFSAGNNGIGIPMKTSKFISFSKSDYDEIYTKLVSGEIHVYNEIEDSTTADLTLTAAQVNYIK
jgi:basic membrane protein A